MLGNSWYENIRHVPSEYQKIVANIDHLQLAYTSMARSTYIEYLEKPASTFASTISTISTGYAHENAYQIFEKFLRRNNSIIKIRYIGPGVTVTTADPSRSEHRPRST